MDHPGSVNAPVPSIQPIESVIPWLPLEIQLDVPTGFWAFNPSVIRMPDGQLMCSVRCANYHLDANAGTSAMKPGTNVPLGRVMPTVVYNRNMMVTLDPKTMKTVTISEMQELDGAPRVPVTVRGYDDLRLAWTAQDGLCAVANVAHLREHEAREMCVLKIHPQTHNIIGVHPLRGPWSETAQKNWSPFTGTGQLRMLYSVERGGIHTRAGRILEPRPRHELEPVTHANVGPSIFAGAEKITLRGGTQLVRITPYPGRWLGLAHGVSDVGESGLHYWHCWYVTDEKGRLLERSRPMKLSSSRIEFAAGLALEPDTGRLVVSYGVGDDRAMLAVTRLDAVIKLLRKVAPLPVIPPPEPIAPPRRRVTPLPQNQTTALRR